MSGKYWPNKRFILFPGLFTETSGEIGTLRNHSAYGEDVMREAFILPMCSLWENYKKAKGSTHTGPVDLIFLGGSFKSSFTHWERGEWLFNFS